MGESRHTGYWNDEMAGAMMTDAVITGDGDDREGNEERLGES
jgi:hypothetical protein